MTRPITDPGLLVEVPLWQERCDRDDEARRAELDRTPPRCVCLHDDDDHIELEGCARRWCPCGWWPA